MRGRMIDLLVCPNVLSVPLQAFALTTRDRDGTEFSKNTQEIMDADDIVQGVLMSEDGNSAYPIYESIGLLLADADTERDRHIDLLSQMRGSCPQAFQIAIDRTISRLRHQKSTFEGEWNHEEMEYYDRAVRTDQLREEMKLDIEKKPLWNIFIPRERHIIRHVSATSSGTTILEIGCGNARTVFHIFNPQHFNYQYIGVDISLARLMLAKSIILDGDFFQASATRLPFKDGQFYAVFSFGVLHHMPEPLVGLQECLRTLESGGFVGFSEPIDTPKLFREGSIFKKFLERRLVDYEHSKHDNEINLESTLNFLKAQNLSIVDESYSHSVFRPLIDKVCKHVRGQESNRKLHEAIIVIDGWAIRTICRVTPRLGPRGVTILARRPNCEI